MKHRVLMGVAALVLAVAPLSAQEAGEVMPLRDVVLFSSGVGYFGREGTVRGEANIPLTFRAEQINDVLKSLVVFDPQGTVRPVTYTTKDSIGRRLQMSGMSLYDSVSLGELLRQFQGTQVRLEANRRVIEGRLISVNTRRVPVINERIRPPQPEYSEVEFVNVLTEKGLVSTRLDEVTQVRLLDERLDRELRENLELLATGLDDQSRNVMLRFGGQASREVRAGYLLETPVWKTSYRLVLDNEGEAKPYLQGWAIVENTTDSDWNAVNLSLVSGRPISFIQDLYQPLYVPRPRVAPQVIGSPYPQTYGETITPSEEAINGAIANAPMPSAATQPGTGGFGLQGPRGEAGPAGRMAMDSTEMNEQVGRRRDIAAVSAQQIQGAAQAAGSARGELFEYAISQPVTLPRQQAAMVPIVGENIGGEALSIFNANDNFGRALNGFRLKNSTGLHLSGGPVTVFAEGIYAGDAQMTDLQPGEDRLISYAVDLDLVVDSDTVKNEQHLVSMQIRHGVLQMNHKHRRVRTYTFRNTSEQAKTVLVQQDFDANYDLIAPETGVEKTADEYRFKVQVPAKSTQELTTTTERLVSSTVGIFDADINVLSSHAHNAEASPQLKAALEEIVRRRQAISEMQATQKNLEAELANIEKDQSRIRENMSRINRESALYKQYVEKFTQQETRIEQILTEVERLRDAETKAQTELRDYINDLTVE